METWYTAGYFVDSLPVRSQRDSVFTPLRALILAFGADRPFQTPLVPTPSPFQSPRVPNRQPFSPPAAGAAGTWNQMPPPV